ncbi:AAA family ATPase [Sphingomicrobium sp. XHP0239]|uniref:chromosome segregation SMC family protein n=1 Tax=Sphingomicrobium maritimum TaxID=3133972 RepID=UPI0031CC4BC9
MKFRRLRLVGFKSFVEPTDMAIRDGLTGIVGPNGCGKSNLLEAIRWAMGEGSPKSLRGGGMEDVIFAGTESRPARDFAEVTLTVERGPEAGEDAGENEVTRRIERGAGSAYRLNGRDVRAKDVALLFADAATGAHSPALVSQGKIGAVISAKPQQRRQLLEEAAGISGLHARRKDAEQKLRGAEANLERLDRLLGEQAARAAALKRQANAAARYRQLSDKIRLVEAQLMLAEWRAADVRARETKEQAQKAEEAVERLRGERDAALLEQSKAGTALSTAREEAVAARSAGQELAHRLATARAEAGAVTRRIEELDAAMRALDTDRARETALREDAARAIEALGKEQKALEQRLAGEEEDAREVAAKLSAAEAEASDREAELAALLAKQAAGRAERQVAEVALEAAQAQADRIENELRRLAEQEATLDADEDYRSALKLAEKAIASQEKRAAEAVAAIEEAEEAGERALSERDATEAARADARAALAAVEAEVRTLRAALSDGEHGALDGVRAAPGYERALAAALGDDLLADIGGEGPRRWSEGLSDHAKDAALPKGAHPLSDHVDAPPALQRRLAMIGVVEADEGQSLAAGQRLVTRNGRMRRWDGFVVEGEGAAEAERLERANRLAALEEQLPSLDGAAREAEASREAVERRVVAARETERAARSRLASVEEAMRGAARDADRARSAIERAEARAASLKERRAELKPLHESACERLAEAQRALASLSEDERLDRDIASARTAAAKAGETVAGHRAAVATRRQGIEAARDRMSAAGREQDGWRARARDAEARLDETASRNKAQRAEREELSGSPERLAEEIERLEKEQGQIAARVADKDAAMTAAQAAQSERDRAHSQTAEAFAAARERRAGAAERAQAAEEQRQRRAAASFEEYDCSPQGLAKRFDFDAEALPATGELRESLAQLTAQRERIGPVNLVAESELAELEAEQDTSAVEKEELAEAIHRLRGSIGHLNREGRQRLLAAFEQVDGHFRSLFTTLFGGGQAHLELVESDDPLEAGLEIMAQPPGKKLSALTLLSGGEQALTAVALIFAIFLTNPAPICVLDEVDAPLDDANVERFCDLLARMNAETETRYLIVTHNAVTMSRMDRLYGVTMIEQGVSRLVSVDLSDAERLVAAE